MYDSEVTLEQNLRIVLGIKGLACKEAGIKHSPYYSLFLLITDEYICLEDLIDGQGYIPAETLRLIAEHNLFLAKYK